MRVYDFSDYRRFVQKKIKSMPKGGRGELLKMSRHMQIHTTTLSQILKGDRQLTLEQGTSACSYFGLNEKETQYFLFLIQHDRAGTKELKLFFQKLLDEKKRESLELVNLIPHSTTLTHEQKAIFYSNWYYSAIRVLSSIDKYKTAEDVAAYFRLPRKLVNEAIEFLVASGLCEQKGDQIAPGPQYTHLEASSLLSARHHSNWRQKAMERYTNLSSDELVYTSPMSLSREDALKIRQLLMSTVQHINQIREPSPAKEAYCLNLDWIKVM